MGSIEDYTLLPPVCTIWCNYFLYMYTQALYCVHSLRKIPDWPWNVRLSNITRCWLDTSQSGWDIHWTGQVKNYFLGSTPGLLHVHQTIQNGCWPTKTSDALAHQGNDKNALLRIMRHNYWIYINWWATRVAEVSIRSLHIRPHPKIVCM